MTRKRAKSADQTSFGTPGTTETSGALRSPPVASGGNPAVCYRPRRSRVHLGNVGSHGCIRMFNEDVIDLYERVRVGTRVIVTWQSYS